MTISTMDQVVPGLAFAARRLAPPLLAMTAFGLGLSLLVHLVVIWQGGTFVAPGEGSVGWLGFVVNGDRVDVSGVHWLGVAAAGLTAFGLAASLPSMILTPLVSAGVTRRAAVLICVLVVATMLAVVMSTLALTAAVVTGNLLAAADAVALGSRALTVLAVVMFAVLPLGTAWLYGPVHGGMGLMALFLFPVNAAIVGWWPPPAVLAAIVVGISMIAFVILVLRLPVR